MARTEEQRKWLSSKLEASLMGALDGKAKSIGLSRSEAVRKAVQQWVDGSSEEPADAVGSGEEIIERLARIETMLESPGRDEAAGEHSEEDTGSSEKNQNGEGLGQMEMYEGEDLLNWIESEDAKEAGSQDSGPETPLETT